MPAAIKDLQEQNEKLRSCIRDLLAEPRTKTVLISKKHGPMTPMNATFLKGQVVAALKLLAD